MHYEEAVRWYWLAAEQGHADGQYKLGCAYYFGQGIEEDDFKAARWFRRAAMKGHAHAQHKLGKTFHYGDGVVEKDDVAAYAWLCLAFQTGHAGAAEDLVRVAKQMTAKQIREGQRMAWELQDRIKAKPD